MKRIFSFIILSLIFILPADAQSVKKYISDSGLGFHSYVAVDILNLKNNKKIYSQNENKLVNPASILKVYTFASAYNNLGKDYKFETELYKYNNDIYLKLGADALLKSKDLKNLFAQAKTKYDFTKVQNIFIDDTIIDKIPYPSGWMQDDIWPNQRAITPYIIDSNMLTILLRRSSFATTIDIIQNDSYKLPVINELKLSTYCEDEKVNIERVYGESSSIIALKGCLSKDKSLNLPVLDPEINFKIKLKEALSKNEIIYSGMYTSKKTPSNALKIANINHSIQEISKNIFINSDNFSAETVFKVGAAKYINYAHPATLDDAINMFYEFYNDVSKEDIKIADGSGVSRYNLINAKTALMMFKKALELENFKELLATSNEGTLSNRLLFLKDNLRAKTGTLSNMSSILAMFETQKGNSVILSSIVQNSPKRNAVLKNYENGLISLIYRKY